MAETVERLEIKSGSKILDAGCGNGRTFRLFEGKKIKYYGIDISKKLLDVAKKENGSGKFILGDVTKLPYKDAFFDVTISIATLHHIPSEELRQKAINELYRVTKSGGIVFIANWYFWKQGHYLKSILKQFIDPVEKRMPFGDFLVSWKTPKGKIIAHRYFHAWTKTETFCRLKKAGFKDIKTMKTKDGKDRNILTIAHK